jgi:hypothetical protein
VARTVVNNRLLGLPSGLLLACPNPSPLAGVDEAVAQALSELGPGNVTGKKVTPFLLARVAELTGGESLRSNIALVENNARVGAEVALAVRELEREMEEREGRGPQVAAGGEAARKQGGQKQAGQEQAGQKQAGRGRHGVKNSLVDDFPEGGIAEELLGDLDDESADDDDTEEYDEDENYDLASLLATNMAGRVLVMGGAVVDIIARPEGIAVGGTSNPGVTRESPGGVANNIGEPTARAQKRARGGGKRSGREW